MVIDASALLAILQGEPEQRIFTVAISADTQRLICPINLLEAHMVMLTRRREAGVRKLEEFLAIAMLVVAPVDATQTSVARDAFDRFDAG